MINPHPRDCRIDIPFPDSLPWQCLEGLHRLAGTDLLSGDGPDAEPLGKVVSVALQHEEGDGAPATLQVSLQARQGYEIRDERRGFGMVTNVIEPTAWRHPEVARRWEVAAITRRPA